MYTIHPNFEYYAIIAAHTKAADTLDKHALNRRELAQQRGLIWKRYLAAAIRTEQASRKHRDRIKEVRELLELG